MLTLIFFFTNFSDVSIVDFEHVFVSWEPAFYQGKSMDWFLYQGKSMDWFLYDRNLCDERVKI